jgi:hypothetical protein
MLLGARDAATEDVDFINQIPGPIRYASEEFAKQEGLKLAWFSDRARVVNDYLKFGYGKDGVQDLFLGKALKLRCPSPDNLLISKPCRIADSGPRLQDIEDVRRLALHAATFDSVVTHLLKKERANSGDVAKAKKALAVLRKDLYRA